MVGKGRPGTAVTAELGRLKTSVRGIYRRIRFMAAGQVPSVTALAATATTDSVPKDVAELRKRESAQTSGGGAALAAPTEQSKCNCCGPLPTYLKELLRVIKEARMTRLNLNGNPTPARNSRCRCPHCWSR